MLQPQTEEFEIETNADGDTVHDDLNFTIATEADVGTEIDNNTNIPVNSRQSESVQPARIGKKKMKEKGVSEEEKTLKVIGQYFEDKAARSSSAHTAKPHEDDVFCEMLAIEMKKVQNPTLRRSMKRKLMELVMDIQERQEEEEKRQSGLLQQDHTNIQEHQQLYTWMICTDQSAQDTQQVITQGNIPEEIQFEHEQ